MIWHDSLDVSKFEIHLENGMTIHTGQVSIHNRMDAKAPMSTCLETSSVA